MTEAKAYFARIVFYDWLEEDCERIIRPLMPQLEDGKKLFIADQILPPPGNISIYAENTLRRMDMFMFSVAGGKERSLDERKTLFAKADVRLKFAAYRQSRGRQLPMLEVEVV
jgi:hypothetical protein